MLIIKRLKKSYGDKVVLNGVDLELKRGKICGLLGLNGSGKSTLMKLICGLTLPDSGEIFINGQLSDISQKKVGAMIEAPAFYDDLTGRQNLEVFRTLCADLPKKNIEEVLNLTGIIHYADIPYKKYSLGMKQRLYFAFALLKKPDLLILDEPFANIDPVSVKLFEDIIKSMSASGCSVLISGHIIAEIKNICHCGAILDNGKIVKFIDDVNNCNLEDAFLNCVRRSGDVL